MSASTAQDYFELFGDEPQARLALLACSASLRLDDKTAHGAIELVAQSNGSTEDLLRRVKSLGCVWKDWDGSWYVAEDVRPYLLKQLHQDVPEYTVVRLREHFAWHADSRAERLPPDGQVTSHDKLLLRFEAAYQRVLIPEKSLEGAAQLADLWQHSPAAVATATARSVDYLADELNRQLKRLPDEVLFLRGMAARSRGDRKNQEKYFRSVWERGRHGYIYAIAAHLFGLLIQRRDRAIAERVLRDSVSWYVSPYHRGLVYHSLGNLLARDRRRWPEAEQAYIESLKILEDSADRTQVFHSLGNLLARDRRRWPEAEQAYIESLKILEDSAGRGQVFHSLGNLLARDRHRWQEAEHAYQQSLSLLGDPRDQKQVYHSLGNLLTRDRHRWHEAEHAYQQSLDLDKSSEENAQVYHSLGNLLAKDRRRWHEAERAYRRSIELAQDDHSRAQRLHSLGKLLFRIPGRKDEAESALEHSFRLYDMPDHRVQVSGTWATALLKIGDPESDSRAEEYALRGLEIAPDNPQRGLFHSVLARVYERQGDFQKAIEACKAWKEADRKQGRRSLAEEAQAKIDELSKKIKKPR